MPGLGQLGEGPDVDRRLEGRVSHAADDSAGVAGFAPVRMVSDVVEAAEADEVA